LWTNVLRENFVIERTKRSDRCYFGNSEFGLENHSHANVTNHLDPLYWHLTPNPMSFHHSYAAAWLQKCCTDATVFSNAIADVVTANISGCVGAHVALVHRR
jgi:hypothetical protein